ncbi:GH1 family beta-glucosidase [Piscinibacter terrae]|uniref:Beta-glucosidase n=1 Tax=Piscinibacter terrae TaxID=2496871 RepID=A0A3N7K0G9_9BURK|nr:GH1 family beta-glucosidase [Albitalea terrae]RQP26509.1 beta-glucosidase [Albitalea terrae]
MKSHPPIQFPSQFLWGAATSAYQIEGAHDVDGRAPSIWDSFAKTPGRVVNGDNGDIACDSYRRVEEDVALLKQMGARAYRFSIAWPRVMPHGRGEVNPLGIAYYKRLVSLLRDAGIAPMATLYHWDLPQALHDEGGWMNRRTAQDFAAFAAVMFDALGESVPFWFTVNEPWCASFLSHAIGEHAPGEKDLNRAVTVAHHLLLGHGLAMTEFRKRKLGGQIGMAPNVDWREPYSQDPEDIAACERGLDWFNRWFIDPIYHGRYPAAMAARYAELGIRAPIEDGDMATISQHPDMLGINYYTGSFAKAPANPLPLRPGDSPQRQMDALRNLDTVNVPGFAKTHIDWPIFPEGFTKVLTWLRDEYGNPPVFITENGACDNTQVGHDGQVHDALRVEYMHRHVIALHRAIRSGCDIRGYMAWSLLDNFEWAYGYGKRFGLIHVDFGTQQRTPKDSFHWYSQLIANNGCAA